MQSIQAETTPTWCFTHLSVGRECCGLRRTNAYAGNPEKNWRYHGHQTQRRGQFCI